MRRRARTDRWCGALVGLWMAAGCGDGDRLVRCGRARTPSVGMSSMRATPRGSCRTVRRPVAGLTRRRSAAPRRGALVGGAARPCISPTTPERSLPRTSGTRPSADRGRSSNPPGAVIRCPQVSEMAPPRMAGSRSRSPVRAPMILPLVKRRCSRRLSACRTARWAAGTTPLLGDPPARWPAPTTSHQPVVDERVRTDAGTGLPEDHLRVEDRARPARDSCVCVGRGRSGRRCAAAGSAASWTPRRRVGFQNVGHAADQRSSSRRRFGMIAAVTLRLGWARARCRVSPGPFPGPPARTGYVDLHITGCMSSRWLC